MKPLAGYCLLFFVFIFPLCGRAQKTIIHKDSIIYKIIYRDTIIYKHDTVRVNHYIHSDTVRASSEKAVTNTPRRKLLNPNNWGIGPSVGAYYSPFNGFDVNIGFGIQYYILSIPSFRNPHSAHRKSRK